MALTAEQLSFLRDMSSDDEANSTGNYMIADATWQSIWDSTTEGNGDLDTTLLYGMRRLEGKLAKKVALSGEFGSSAYNQWWEHVRDMLKKLEARLGIGGGSLTVGVLKLGLNEPCPDGYNCD